MKKKRITHTVKILIKLLNNETLISSDVFASNTNQYFSQIKNQGIQLIEWNDPAEGRHHKRRLEMSEDNINKAKEYLKKISGDEVAA